jgi:hypothetical protein
VKFKHDVRLDLLAPQMLVVLMAVERAVAIINKAQPVPYEATVTSGNDGKHSARSFHYNGNALDFRTKDLPRSPYAVTAHDYAMLIREGLTRDFDVVVEEDHIHVEFDPKEPIGA